MEFQSKETAQLNFSKKIYFKLNPNCTLKKKTSTERSYKRVVRGILVIEIRWPISSIFQTIWVVALLKKMCLNMFSFIDKNVSSQETIVKRKLLL